MASYSRDIELLKEIIEMHLHIKKQFVARLLRNAEENPDAVTNPVRSLDDLYAFLNYFLTAMPWMGLEYGEGIKSNSSNKSLFYRIDQSIGYVYYIFGELQFEPEIAEWLKLYHRHWAEYLDSTDSWNDEYYELAKSDPIFELNGEKYESSDNWHTWNEFFARRLSTSVRPPQIAEGQTFPWLSISGNTLDLKTAKIGNVSDLLGDSPYKEHFENGLFTHITLDIYNYHRFHSPVDGKIIDIQEIDGILSDGGKIIWDVELEKYRYELQENIGFQMIEKRTAIMISLSPAPNCENRMLAIIPIGVAQVGSILISEDIKIGGNVIKGQELGHFLFGGSDVVVITNNKIGLE